MTEMMRRGKNEHRRSKFGISGELEGTLVENMSGVCLGRSFSNANHAWRRLVFLSSAVFVSTVPILLKKCSYFD